MTTTVLSDHRLAERYFDEYLLDRFLEDGITEQALRHVRMIWVTEVVEDEPMMGMIRELADVEEAVSDEDA